MAMPQINMDGKDDSKLAKQDLSKLNIKELTPLTPMVISRQATINIGMFYSPNYPPNSIQLTN